MEEWVRSKGMGGGGVNDGRRCCRQTNEYRIKTYNVVRCDVMQ